MAPAAFKACPATAGFFFGSDVPPAVVLGGINVVRSAGLGGIPIIVATSDPSEPALASRYCSMGVMMPPLAEADAATTALERVAERCGTPLPLLFGNDDALRFVYARRERLGKHFLPCHHDRPPYFGIAMGVTIPNA